MLSFLVRSVPRTKTSHQKLVYGEGGRASLEFPPPSSSCGDGGLMRATVPPHRARTSILDPGSFYEPPVHFHPSQVEIFTVVSGTMRVFLPGPPASSASGIDILADQNVTVPRRQLHGFQNGSDTEPLVLDVRLDPALPSDEMFFRNAYSYAEDCLRMADKGDNKIQGKTESSSIEGGRSTRTILQGLPNIFQVALFHYECQVIPAILPGTLPRYIADPVAYGLLWFMGVFVGKWMLGFKGSYEEYHNPKGR